MVKKFSWRIQQTTFTSDVFLIPLGCCDLLLEVEWLVTLGDITWNFSNLSMEFKVNVHVLHGATTQNIKTAAKQHFIKAMEEGVHFSILQLCNTNT